MFGCFFKHNWTNWTEPKSNIYYTYQTRKCLKCNEREVKILA